MAIGALLGSIPTAWLVIKYRYGKEITGEGSGNVGAMNSYEVTNSKATGIIVLIIDLLKGLISVFLCRLFFPGEFVFPAVSLVSAVFTHCFNPWLRFKGGRGLASAAGGSLILFPPLPFLWILFFGAAILIKRNVHFGNVWATVLTAAAVSLFSQSLAVFTFPKSQNADLPVFFSFSLFGLILIRHLEPVLQLIDDMKNKDKENTNVR